MNFKSIDFKSKFKFKSKQMRPYYYYYYYYYLDFTVLNFLNVKISKQGKLSLSFSTLPFSFISFQIFFTHTRSSLAISFSKKRKKKKKLISDLYTWSTSFLSIRPGPSKMSRVRPSLWVNFDDINFSFQLFLFKSK